MAELLRLFVKQGVEVRVVMTSSATAFVTPLTFQALSGHAVHTTLLDEAEEKAMGHINLARWADALVIAPATANSLAKFSQGLADDLLSTLYLVCSCPVYIAPAMNQAMWHHPATQRNVQQLLADGVTILEPEAGEQACGDVGVGRLMVVERIVERVLRQTPLLLAGLSVLISAGATREPLDPVRYITNRSSGKMGYALAEVAINLGATVTLVSGVTNLPQPQQARFIQIETAAEMFDAVMNSVKTQAIYIGAAAVADYSPVQVSSSKLKKQANDSSIALQKTTEILATVEALKQHRPFTVGFAAETDNLEDYALGKLRDKNLDMIAANWVGRSRGGFDSHENALTVFWSDGQKNLEMSDKNQLAGNLLKLIAERLNEKSTA